MFQNLRRVQVAASDFPRSRRFYGETLGLPEIGGFESDWVEFGLGPIILKLVPLRPGEVPSRNQVAAILSTDKLDEALTTLKERGVTVTRGPIDEFTGRFAEILDPDGYRLIVYQPSDLHPDEEWVQTSHVDDIVKQKLLLRRQKEKAKAAPKKAAKSAEKKSPAKKAAPKKAEKSAPAKKSAKSGEKPKKGGAKAPAKKSAKPAPKTAAKAAPKGAKPAAKSAPKGAGGGKKPAKKTEASKEKSAARKPRPSSTKGKKK
jgi:predicted enzyme related to lactoylglutathione lyase